MSDRSRLRVVAPPLPSPATEWSITRLILQKGMVRLDLQADTMERRCFTFDGEEAATLLSAINTGDHSVIPMYEKALNYLNNSGLLDFEAVAETITNT